MEEEEGQEEAEEQSMETDKLEWSKIDWKTNEETPVKTSAAAASSSSPQVGEKFGRIGIVEKNQPGSFGSVEILSSLVYFLNVRRHCFVI